ncbi:MAG: flavodoxin family protein [Spirochaetota bacterium]
MNERSAVLVSGSPRTHGNTAFALGVAGETLTELGYRTRRLQLSAIDFGSCIACERCRRDGVCTGLDDDLTPWYPRLLAAEVWVLASPVYNYNVTSWMKAFIDRLYCFYDFDPADRHRWSSRIADRGIRAVTAVTGEQLSDHDLGFASEALTRPLEALGVGLACTVRFRGYFGPGALGRDHARVRDYRTRLAGALRS